jgi:formylglycine-generating enzyme required for sulfatase activity
MAFVLIPAGGFSMGSSGSGGNPPYSAPVHNVSFGKAFYMAKYECTQAQWKAIMGTNPSHFQTSPQQPVESLFWSDIATSGTGYLDKLNTALSGYQFRLPSEAEWEYAARAGSSMAFHFGDETTQLPTFAWTTANASGTTHPVGQKQPNAWGLYDMHGNVWEWTADDWHDNYTGAPTNGSAWVDSPRAASRVFRGGSFNDEGTPVAVRYGYDDRNFASGFRLVVPVPK